MAGNKRTTFSTLIGLIVMGILLAIFNDSPLYVKGIIGGGAALVSWALGKMLDNNKEEIENNKTNYPVILYITTPLLIFIAQFLAEFNRSGSITIDTFAYSLGMVGTYYIIVHFYEYFLEKWVNKRVSEPVRRYLGWGIVIMFIAIMLVFSFIA